MDVPFAQTGNEILATMEIVRERVVTAIMNNRKLRQEMCGKVPLTLQQVRMLDMVERHDGAGNKEIAALLHISSASASVMVERLVEMNLLEREIPNCNRRTVCLHLSKNGKRIISTHRQMMHAVVNDLLTRMGEKDAQAWLAVCRRIRTVLSDQ